MRIRVWMMVCVATVLAMSSMAAHAAGAGKFTCFMGSATPVISFPVVSYDVSTTAATSGANAGRAVTTVSMRAPKANKAALMQMVQRGSLWYSCQLGPAAGGPNLYTLSEVFVTSVNDADRANKDKVDVKLSCKSATLGGKRKNQ
jgi:hypothetical protein